MHFSSPRTLLGLLAPLALTVSGCNPLVYDELIGQAYVETFDLRGPTAGSAFGRQALHIDDDLTGQEHLLIMGPDDSTLTWLRLNDGASAVATYPSLDQLQALVFPIESVQQAINGGLARVPDPMGNGRAHAIVAYKSPSDPSRARVVRFRVSDFARTNDALEDIRAPERQGTPIGSFGSGLAAINLDAGPEDPGYEVLVGSDFGALVFDTMGENTETYLAAREAALAADSTAFDGDNEAQGFHYTRCADLAEFNSTTSGALLPNGEAAFAVATEAGIRLVGADLNGSTNAIGAPVFDCARRQLDSPTGASLRFGEAMLVADLDGDQLPDLIAGDPGAQQVHIWYGDAQGVSGAPAVTLSPEETSGEYGYSIGWTDLGGMLGRVLSIGAPESELEGQESAGKVFVYGADLELVRVLADTEPGRGTRHGRWTGGLALPDTTQQELIILGQSEGRIHAAIESRDPEPGS